MRTIIAGGREIEDERILLAAIEECGFADQIDTVLSGGAPGVDTLGEMWADRYGIPLARYPADWKKHGRGAGPIRNAQMAAHADALIAIPGAGPGTRDMIQRAYKAGLKVYVHEPV